MRLTKRPFFLKAIAKRRIRNKLILLVGGALTLSMLVVFLIYASLTIKTSISNKHHDLDMLANITARNLEASLQFSDKKSAAEVLQALRENPNINSAELKDIGNRIVASYNRSAVIPHESNLGRWLALPLAISVNHPIIVNNQMLGKLIIQESLNSVWESLNSQLLQMAAAAVAALIIAVFLSNRLAAVVIGPIQQMAATARRISQDGNYQLRVDKLTNDEVGILADEINNMLATINQRDLALQESQEMMRSITDNASNMIFIKDLAGRYLFVNSKFDEIFRASNATILGKSDYDIFPKDFADSLTRNDQIIVQSGQPLTIEEFFPHDDGVHAYISVRFPLRKISDEIYAVCGISTDVTERKLIENDLLIAAAAFESQEGMMVTDPNWLILRVNRAFTKITGYTSEEVIGKNPRILSSGRHDANFYAAMWESINNNGEWEGEIWNRRKNGEVYPEHLTITAVRNPNGTLTNYIATLTDITSVKAAAAKIELLAFYDPLTQLPNRRLLLDRLHQALASSQRSGKKVALLFIDLDDFKTLNDTLGHDMGDLLLQRAAERLTASVREGDTIARMGGDEFVVMLEDLSEQDIEAAGQTETIANKIMAALNQRYQLATHEYSSTASIGATLFGDHNQNEEELLKRADIAMYHAKKTGRNRLCFFDPQLQANITARVKLEADLRLALEDNQFRLYYQIQVSRRQAVGAEALIRWQHPHRGLVLPGEFISMIEETGMILPIGQWVLETACAQLKAWECSAHAKHLQLAVNVSARQFHQADFVQQVSQVLSRSAINPNRLKLELTESLVLDDVDDTILKMNALHEIGVCFSLDDFGTGYSSLAYLTQLPIDQLKIDQSFVRNITTGSNNAIIVQTIIAMGNNLGKEVIAEGVETEEQRAFLEKYGCQICQGYLFSKPIPLEEFEALLKHG